MKTPVTVFLEMALPLSIFIGMWIWAFQKWKNDRKIQEMWDKIPWKRAETKVIGKDFLMRGGPPAFVAHFVYYLEVVIAGILDRPRVDEKIWDESVVHDTVLVEYKIHPDNPSWIGPSRVVKLLKKGDGSEIRANN